MANSSRYLTVIVLLVLEVFLVESQSKALLKHLQKKDNDKNILFSPFLLAEGLAQLYLGSKGTTAEELKNVIPYVTHNPDMNMELYLKEDRKNLQSNGNNVTIQFGNQFFVSNSMHIYQEYETKINTIFQAKTQKVDFGSERTLKEINEWVAQKTNNMITKAIKELNGNVIFMLISTIYFKGLWKNSFLKERTLKDSFHVPQTGADAKTIQVDMMNTKGNYKYEFLKDLNADAVSLPYANSDITMLILLPKAVDGINNLLDNLGGLNIHGLLENRTERELELSLPKFKFKYSVVLNDVVKEIGVKQIFGAPDFSAMTNGTMIVDEIFQEAVIEVNEEGTEAAAVQVIMESRNAAPQIPRIHIDHPFVFYIKDSKRIYFAGQVRDPSI